MFFRQSEYDPGSPSGRELSAHELTHVVQQNGASVQRKLMVSHPDDAQEVEAERVARQVMQLKPKASGPREREEDDTNKRLNRLAEARKPEEDKKKEHLPEALAQRQEFEEDNKHAPTKLNPRRSSLDVSRNGREVVSRMPETLALPDWGSTILKNDSRMTLNPFARLTADGKVIAVNSAISGSTPASFIVPKCTKSGVLEVVTTGYWFQNNTTGNYSGEGTATVKTSFDVNEKGEVHLKPAIANLEATGRVAQITASGSLADNPPQGGSLAAQVAIVANDQKSATASAGILGFTGSNASSNSLSRGYRADVTLEKRAPNPQTKSQPVYYQVGKHQTIGSKDPGQPANIRDIYAFLNGLPKDVRKELEDGAGSHKAAITVIAQASVTTPRNPKAGFNVELTEKRRDSVVRLLLDFLGTGAKIKAKAIGELEAVDPGESGMERVATITVSWEDDSCDTAVPKP